MLMFRFHVLSLTGIFTLTSQSELINFNKVVLRLIKKI